MLITKFQQNHFLENNFVTPNLPEFRLIKLDGSTNYFRKTNGTN